MNQGEASTIEHRTDLYLSTLSGYVEALGGTLEIRAVFPDSEVRISQFETLPQAWWGMPSCVRKVIDPSGEL